MRRGAAAWFLVNPVAGARAGCRARGYVFVVLASIISTVASILWGAPVVPTEPARKAGSDHLLGRSDHLHGPADGLPSGTAVGGSVDLGGLELTAPGGPQEIKLLRAKRVLGTLSGQSNQGDVKAAKTEAATCPWALTFTALIVNPLPDPSC